MSLRRAIGVTLGALGLVLAPTMATPAQAIVGGTQATASDGAVSLWTLDPTTPQRNRCTGVLIQPQWVLTAGHCVDVLLGHQPQARIGLDNVTSRDAAHPRGYVPRAVVAGYVHPGYDPDSLAHDVGLLKLGTPVPSDVQRPMSIGDPLPAGAQARVQGWGWPCDDVAFPSCPDGTFGPARQLDVTVRPDAACVDEWYPDHESCYAATSGRHEMTCFGDSGAPLYTRTSTSVVLRALAIYDGDDWNATSCSSAPDGGPGLGVAVDVRPHQAWILVTMIAGQQPPHGTATRAATSHRSWND